MVYMFNELSLAAVQSKAEALLFLKNFVEATSRAADVGFDEIRMHEDSIQTLYQIPIYDGYNIDRWLSDDEVNKDLKDKFRLILSTFPLLKNDDFATDEFTRSEFTHTLEETDRPSFGLGAGYLQDTLSISLFTHACWNGTMIPLTQYVIHVNGQDEEIPVQSRHFFNVESLNAHLEWWEQLQVENLATSAQLWEKREEFFPKLIFTREVEQQIKKLGFSKFLFQIIDRLRVLNEYASKWTAGDFDVTGVNKETNLNISTESDATLRSYGTLRKFTVPDEGRKVFHLHIKTGELRFHFYANPASHKIYIGYIGKHLRTVRYD